MTVLFQKTKGLTDKETHYCPGCTHGIVHRLVAESLEELGVLGGRDRRLPGGLRGHGLRLL